MKDLVTAIVGAQWGDEGKGKMVDYLAERSEYVVRFQGGSNAGHTINNHYGRFSLHLLPSGIFNPGVQNVLGNGVAVNLEKLVAELDEISGRGVPESALWISNRAQLVLPQHILLDVYEEERLGDKKFGSTKAGIAPHYGDRYRKKGVQVGDLFDRDRLRDAVEASLTYSNVLIEHLYGKPKLSVDEVLDQILPYAARIEPMVTDTAEMLNDALAKGKRILLEGQLGTLRDIEHGIYPFSTSSSTLAGYGSVGAGVPPHQITRIMAVAKAYSSKVGTGPFVTEIEDLEEAARLRAEGGDKGEYGATTGRPRDVGWFDAVATRYGVIRQGATEVALTNLDVLGYLDEIPICTAYEIAGEKTTSFPVTALLPHARPIYERLPGWDVPKKELSKIRLFNALPKTAQRYVERIEALIGVPIRLISVGPAREEVIIRS